jgi:hypothetical protein
MSKKTVLSYDLLVSPPEVVLTLLAQGINEQFKDLQDNYSILRQNKDELNSLLIPAIPRLSALYMCEGKEDKAASVHSVMEMATQPVKEWGIDYFARDDFPYREIVLIDPETLVPTLESYELAIEAGGYGEDQILERKYHNQVRELVKSAHSRKDDLYTAIREFIVRHPLATSKEIEEWKDSLKFPRARSMLTNFYRDIPSQWTHQELVHRCSHCGGLLKPHPDKNRYPDGICVVSQCRRKGVFPKTDEVLVADDLKLLQNQLLTYWVGPGLDEIEIYDAALKAGRKATLYHSSDACDISLEYFAVGIDAKSYSSASLLIKRLNTSIGRLVEYDRKIIAISDELNDKAGVYMNTLRLQRSGAAKNVDFMSVSSVIKSIKSGKI